jgi:Protein of unknown function (DUF3050)
VIRLLHQQIAGLRRQLADHPLYHQIRSVDDLRIFLESHVFAVWDFMSLLKYLQRELTSIDVPWLSTTAVSGPTARLINEIVLREETDELPDGRILSHFQLYREAMTAIGANTSAIDTLLNDIERGKSVEEALGNPAIPRAAATFVEVTFSLIGSGQLPAVAAAFAFGREEVIPEVLRNLGAQVSESAPHWTLFELLLERRTELGAARQSRLAGQMIEEICASDDDRWHEAILAARRSLEARLALWDGILAQLDQRRPPIGSGAV